MTVIELSERWVLTVRLAQTADFVKEWHGQVTNDKKRVRADTSIVSDATVLVGGAGPLLVSGDDIRAEVISTV